MVGWGWKAKSKKQNKLSNTSNSNNHVGTSSISNTTAWWPVCAKEKTQKEKAVKWYQVASQKGTPLAKLMLGTIGYQQAQSKRERQRAINLLNDAAKHEFAQAYYNLAAIAKANQQDFLPFLDAWFSCGSQLAFSRRPASSFIPREWPKLGPGRGDQLVLLQTRAKFSCRPGASFLAD